MLKNAGFSVGWGATVVCAIALGDRLGVALLCLVKIFIAWFMAIAFIKAIVSKVGNHFR